ncbi:MAG: hypothetical protein H2054_12475 [Sphingomonas sp.]|uniref:hypothetical protein n=1 Tax=Sphingomonas sp. TaxID=28214 RepID=UPI0018165553|nr:hypothetical protein [Zymomonas sp.]MBA4773900.1 hypothetical protein [Sphingomonas sp.]
MIRMVLLIGIGLLGGCAKLGAAARVDPPVVARYPNAATSASDCASPSASKDSAVKHGAINLDCFKFPEANGPFVAVKDPQVFVGRLSDGAVSNGMVQDGVISLTITGAKLAPDLPAYDLAVADKRARNRLASILITRSDDICTRDSASIFANEAAFNGIAKILVTGLASAATIVSGERAKTILSGLGAFTSGAADNVNATVYKNLLSQALINGINNERTRLRSTIYARNDEEVMNFNVDEMIRMVNEYHQACSFYKGLEFALKGTDKLPGLEAFAKSEKLKADVARAKEAVNNYTAIAANPALAGTVAKQTADNNLVAALKRLEEAEKALLGTPSAPVPSPLTVP